VTPSPSGIRDNRERGKVGDFLQTNISAGAHLSFVSAYFTLYGFEALQKELESAASLRFLFGEPRFLSGLDAEKTDKKSFDLEESGLSLQNRLKQRALARACEAWIRERVEVRSVIRPGFLHGKLYHIHNGGENPAILGSSNFTLSGLGMSKRPNLELNLVVDSSRDRRELLDWFNELWADERETRDVKEEVLRYLRELYDDYSPRFIYFKTLFHVFEDFWRARQAQNPFDSPTHLLDTQIWDSLFEFQKDGVKGLISRLETHGGAILADAVGLGKTYEALGVIKHFEGRNANVLVLCPKKLRDNWTIYQANNNSQLNPFPRDRFSYTVLSHTDLSRERGKVGDMDLSTFKWGVFDLVVIDESHNFRNNARGRRGDDGAIISRTRYERLMDDIIKAGAKTKVLLLSATPVNNDLKDLRNQMYLLTGDEDRAFSQSLGIGSLKETLAAAQRAFTDWSKRGGERRAATLMESLPSAFFKLMDELTIARSRRHIARHYAHSLAEIGAFPTRNPPVSAFPGIDLRGEFASYDELNDQISDYKLALFSPFRFVKSEFKPLYEEKQVKNFSQQNREHFLVGMMKVNFLKRLESSVHSFAVTLRRTLEKIEDLERRIDAFEKEQNAQAERKQADFAAGIVTDEGDDELAEAFQIGAKNYDLRHINLENWREELKEDYVKLCAVWESAQKITPERDEKLAALKAILADKIENPPLDLDGDANRKTLVFTAFADTASYLFSELSGWLRETYGVHSALVCGGGQTRATWGPGDFASILVNFSPRSKSRARLNNWNCQDELTVLFATDCISEGQNLQDCDLVVNYDIHWNPVRLIQRFGRIDRIGSRNTSVGLVNFWPTPDLNKYINLKNRVEARMALVDAAATTEDNLLAAPDADEDKVRDLIEDDLRYRDKQLLRLKEEILDLEDLRDGVSLDEFSLDDFRQELLNYLEANRRELAEAPLGLHAMVEPHPDFPQLSPGVLWCLRRKTDESAATLRATEAARVNPLEPYFMLYVRDDGQVRYGFPSARLVLEAWRALSADGDKKHEALCYLFNDETGQGQKMDAYNALLKSALNSIAATFQKRNDAQLSLGGRGGQLVSAPQSPTPDTQFQLISWCVIKRPTN